MIKAENITIVSIKDIKLNPKNRNKHPAEQIERLVEILKYQGFRRPVTISNRTGLLTCGEGRYLAAKKIGMTEIPAIFQDYDSAEQEFADSIADNAVDKWAELDLVGINTDVELLSDDFNLDMMGIKDFELISEEIIEGLTDDDAIPEKVEPKANLGDLYLLGEHRLYCGDSTDVTCLETLMGGEKADISFTSPPYNAGKTPNENGKYLNDTDDKDQSEYSLFLKDFTTLCLTYSQYVFVNIQSLSGNKTALINYLYDLKEVYADTIIWDKLNAQPAMANNVLNSRFEYVHIFSFKSNRAIGTKKFRGTHENVFQLSSRADKDFASIHKATFPVSFAEHFVSNFSKNSVLEPFGGSGSTLIACEKTKRKCFIMELDPHYVDVIITRWENFTGKKATLSYSV